ncbi:MAG: FMN-binding protein [Actinomycetia bacterium]|nr:FMN-binding protein [Actinomycetes bacterium]
MSDRRILPPGDPLLARLERLERERQGTNNRQVPTGTSPRQFAPPTATLNARQYALQAARQYAPQPAPQPARQYAPQPASPAAPPASPQAARLAALQAARQPAGQTARPLAGKQARRKRPARVAKFGALALSCATTAGLVYLFADINTTQAANQALAALPTAVPVATTGAAPATPSTVPATTPVVDSATTVVVAPTTIAAPVVPVVQAFNGDVIDTRYGPVQVQLQFTNGGISEVAVVAYPDGDGTSVRINARALPTLRNEVLAAQSAQINSVSGATYTSNAYKKSLQSAIDQARAAGITAIA